ncbi:hypothetical protein WA577_006609 [Blastocystis sp. JDR]
MFSGLTGLADKFTSFIREPVTPLGNAVHDAIYANPYGKPNLQKITDMVLSTNDPDALEEVWFVLSKAMGSSSNDEIRTALKIADYLIKNTGARFHNTCTPLFMRRLKEMILTKGKTGGADNMHLMNDARAMVRVWGEGFLPYASQGRGKVIVEGYQDMQRDGIRFPPAPNEEENKWVPMVSPPQRSYSSTSAPTSTYAASSTPTKRVSDLNPKELYRNVKRLLAKLEEEGLGFFENEKAKSIAEESAASQKPLMVLIDRETTRGDDENMLSHLLTLNDMCQQLNGMYAKYQKKEAAKKKKEDSWSDDDDAPKKEDLWSDEEPAPRKARKPEPEPEVQVRSTRRRANRAEEEEEEEKPAPKKSVNDDLLGLGLWEETPAAPAAPAEAPVKKSRAPQADDWGFDEDEEPAPRRAAKKVSKVDDLFDEEEEEPAPRKPAKKVNKVDDLFDDDDEPAPRRPAKKVSKVDDLFDDDEPAPAPRKAKASRQPDDDDWGFDAPAPRARPSKPAAPAPAPAPAEDPFSFMDFTKMPQAAPAAPAAPAKPAPAPKKDAFDDLFSM